MKTAPGVSTRLDLEQQRLWMTNMFEHLVRVDELDRVVGERQMETVKDDDAFGVDVPDGRGLGDVDANPADVRQLRSEQRGR